MNSKRYGPLILWTLTFIIGAAIRLIAFGSATVWFDIPPEVALWAASILFTLATSEGTYSGARLKETVDKTPEGTGFQISYSVTLSDKPRFTSDYMYLFLGSMTCWILALLFTGHALQAYHSSTMAGTACLVYLLLGYAIAAIAVVLAMRALFATET